MYRLEAQYIKNGTTIDTTNAAALGEFHGAEYATEAEANEARDACQADANDAWPGTDGGITITVEGDAPTTTEIGLDDLPLTITANRVPLTTDIRVPGFTVEAFGGHLRAHVIQTGTEFVPCYLGDPAIHNPWILTARDDLPVLGHKATRSCMCPVVHLKPEATLQAAARAAITAYATERQPGAITFQVEV